MDAKRAAIVLPLVFAMIFLWGCPRDDYAAPDVVITPDEDRLPGEVIGGTRVVEVQARQFEFVPSTIVTDAGQPLRLEVTSIDVDHGFEIPELGIDETLPPHQTQTIEFTPDQAGEFLFRCNVFCGPGHDEMTGVLVVRDPNEAQ